MTQVSAALLSLLQKEVPGLTLVGDPVHRLPNTLNVLFPKASGRLVLEACPDVLASIGSACHADSEEPSAILTALGIPRDMALGAVRLSLGRSTTRSDVEVAAHGLGAAWRSVADTPKTRAALWGQSERQATAATMLARPHGERSLAATMVMLGSLARISNTSPTTAACV